MAEIGLVVGMGVLKVCPHAALSTSMLEVETKDQSILKSGMSSSMMASSSIRGD
jgi:hypothetical protein